MSAAVLSLSLRDLVSNKGQLTRMMVLLLPHCEISSLCFVFFCFAIGTHFVAQAVLDLTMETGLFKLAFLLREELGVVV